MKPTYKELQKQLSESRREFTAANANIHNLELKVAQVVAENAGLKSAIDATVGWQQSTDAENVESVRMLADIQTPATDAYLAEVRAQTRNELIAELEARFTELSLSETLSPELKSGAAGAVGLVSTFRSEPDNEFAAQLRQGAEHE